MADTGQDFISLGIDVSSFNEQKLARVQEFITLFDKLDKYDGKVYNPILGTGIVEFNTSLKDTNQLLTDISGKISNLNTGGTAFKQQTQNVTELSLATKEYAKLQDAAAVSVAKMAALTSDQAKETIALKYNLSETTKAILDEVKGTQDSASAKALATAKSQEYRLEQQRVVETLRSVAKQQDNDSIQLAKAKLQEYRSEQQRVVETLRTLAKQQDLEAIQLAKQSENLGLAKIQSQEYRIEQQRVVESLRALAIQQDKEAALELKNNKQKQIQEEKQLVIAKKESEEASKRYQQDLEQESLLTRNLTGDAEKLKLALKEQALAYSNIYQSKGAKAPETEAALAQYAATAAVVGDIDKKLESAQPKAFGLGKGLSTMYNQLRTIAYILPGIGIAGIFNLAFEAIEKAVDELGIMNTGLQKEIDYELQLNKSLKERVDLYNKIYDLDKKLQSTPNRASVNQQGELDIYKSEGANQNVQLSNQLLIDEKNVIQIGAEITKLGNAPEALKQTLDRSLKVQEDYANQVSTIQKKLDRITNPPAAETQKNRGNIQLSTSFLGDEADLKKELELSKLKLSSEQEAYNRQNDLYSQYLEAQQKYFTSKAALEKFNEDETRKIEIDNNKSQLLLEIARNKEKLDAQISSEKTRLSALKSIFNEEKDVNLQDLNNVLKNPSSTNADRITAQKKYNDDNKKLYIKYQEDYLSITEDYRQRRIKAQESIEKDVLERQAIYNEKLYKNDEKSLGDRLKAYTDYVKQKQSQQDLEYKLSIDTLALKSNDPTAKKEIEALKSARDLQKANLQADAQAQTYDIVYSSLEKQLKAVEDEGKQEGEYNKEKYVKDLTALNDALDRKDITLDQYKEKRKKLERQDGIDALTNQLADDEKELQALRKFQEEKLDEKVKEAKIDLDVAKAGGDQNEIDKAQGKYDALLKVQKNAAEDITALAKKVVDDRLKIAKLGGDDESKLKNKQIDLLIKIEKKLYEGIKQVGDAEYQYKLDMLEKKKAIIDEEYNHQISAVEKSELSLKDKQALEIQLNTEKLENDKNVQGKERALKIQQFEFDRKLSIANIIVGTALAVIKAAPNVPLEIETAALGAIELATVLSTRIPAFAEGTKSFEGGLARYGESGTELIKEPYKSPYLVMTETVSYLPKGTEIIPVSDINLPERGDSSWDQTRWLAKQMKKNNKEVTNVFRPIININLGFESLKKQILGN